LAVSTRLVEFCTRMKSSLAGNRGELESLGSATKKDAWRSYGSGTGLSALMGRGLPDESNVH